MSKYIPTPSRQGKPNSAKASNAGKSKFKKSAPARDAHAPTEQRPQQDGYQRPTRNTTSPRAADAHVEAAPKRDKTSKFEARIGKPDMKTSRFGKREDRGSASRGPSDNTRPQPPRADSRPAYRQDRPISNDVPRTEAPRSTFAERKYGNSAPQRDARPNNDRPYNDRPYNDRPYNDRARNDRPQGDRPQSDRPYNSRPYNDRPYNNRPQTDRPQYNNEARPATDRPATEAPAGNRAERGVTRPKFNNRYERRDNRQGGGRFDRRPRREESIVPFEDRKSGPRIANDSPASEAFLELGVDKAIAQLLFANSITDPTPIQTMAIPVVLQGGDTIGVAQTGTGKTLAFGVPTLMRLTATGQALILAPTRELAMQIDSALRFIGATSALLIGGAPMDRQVRALAKRPKLIIGTPGRVQDHLRQGTFGLRTIEIAILDEADRMLDMGFVTAIREILSATPADAQTLLFSATMAPEVMNITREFLTDPKVLEVPRETLTADTVDQELIVVDHEEKANALATLLSNEQGTVLVFARTRHGARKLAKSINGQGHTAAEIHSDRTLAQRITALNGFKSGLFRVLVATDIAARGIDVKGISLVVNYDIPECAEDYVHRIGRTGRAGARGKAVTIATPAQKRDVWDIEKLISMKLDRSELSQGEIGDYQAKSRGGARQQRQRTWNRR